MPYKDEFDDDPQYAGVVTGILGALDIRARIGARGPFFAAVMLLAAIGVMVSVLWYSYPRASARNELENTPVVRADAGPYRIAPDDPGGMEIPYRESTVFDTLRRTEGGKKAPSRIENLLPESEKPLDRDELFAGLKTDIKPVETAEVSTFRPDRERVVTDMPVESGAAAAPQTLAKAAVPPPAAKPDAKEAEIAAKTEPAAGTPKQKTGDYFVQLGSLKSRADAERLWGNMKKIFPAQLGSLELRIQEADLGAKGTYYRTQAGPLEQAGAQSVCKAVEAKKPGGCLVVKR